MSQGDIWPVRASMPTASGRSKPVPLLRTSAGARFTVKWSLGTW